LIGTHGTPFLSSPSTKRKRIENDKAEEESEEEMGIKRAGWNGKTWVKGEKKMKKEGVVKEEGSDGFESSGSEEWDSEDEVPLAKLRKAKLGLGSSPTTQGHTSSSSIFAGSERRAQLQDVQFQGVVGLGVTAGNSRYQNMVSSATVPRYVPSMEGREWEGMIPTGNVGIDSTYASRGLWRNAFQGGVESWEQGLQITNGKPRKSV
jgi:hypothetical protein